MKALDLFSGAGGMSLGFEQAGIDIVGAADKDEYAIQTYNDNFSHSAVVCDLVETPPESFAETYNFPKDDIDILIGGPPCQGFSYSNHHRNTYDNRTNIIFVFSEYVSYYDPEVFVMENVVGLRSFNRGKTFSKLKKELRDMGYTLSIDTVQAKDYGVCQRRERYFIVGQKSGEYVFPEKDVEPPTVENCIQGPKGDDHIERKHNKKTIEKYKRATVGDTPHGGKSPRVLSKDGIAYTITVSDGKTPIHPTEPRMLSPRETARLQSFPEKFNFSGADGRDRKCKQVGNAVPPKVAKGIAENIEASRLI